MALGQGDLVLVKPGEVVPADGVLVDGDTETDESLLTGESQPVVKCAGAAMVAGAVNRLSPAVMRVEQVGEATRASHIRRLTERAAGQRPHLAEVTDRIAGLVRRHSACCRGRGSGASGSRRILPARCGSRWRCWS